MARASQKPGSRTTSAGFWATTGAGALGLVALADFVNVAATGEAVGGDACASIGPDAAGGIGVIAASGEGLVTAERFVTAGGGCAAETDVGAAITTRSDR